MRKALRHSGVLMMVAVVALGLLGAAYTLWYEDLQLTANVSTGTFNADASIHDINPDDPDVMNGLPVVATPTVSQTVGGVATLLEDDYTAFSNDNFPDGKPQPFCNGVVSTDTSGNTHANDSIDNNSLALTMSGLFPYAGCEFEVDVHNSGSVPFHLALIDGGVLKCVDGGDAGTIAGDDPAECSAVAAAPWSIGIASGESPECLALLGAIATPTPGIVMYDADPGAGIDMKPVQVHTELACTFKLILDQDPDAEGATYKFFAEWRAFQWNETPTGAALNTP